MTDTSMALSFQTAGAIWPPPGFLIISVLPETDLPYVNYSFFVKISCLYYNGKWKTKAMKRCDFDEIWRNLFHFREMPVGRGKPAEIFPETCKEEKRSSVKEIEIKRLPVI